MAGMVTVGCKLPAGLYLQLYDLTDGFEPVMGGGTRPVKVAVPKGNRIKVNGCARENGKDAPHLIVAGAGITSNVDADFFTEWMKQNASLDLVQQKLIFAQGKASDAEAQARDHKTQTTGFERLNPEKMPPEFAGKITTADRPE